jgi:hypothetical protein
MYSVICIQLQPHAIYRTFAVSADNGAATSEIITPNVGYRTMSFLRLGKKKARKQFGSETRIPPFDSNSFSCSLFLSDAGQGRSFVDGTFGYLECSLTFHRRMSWRTRPRGISGKNPCSPPLQLLFSTFTAVSKHLEARFDIQLDS